MIRVLIILFLLTGCTQNQVRTHIGTGAGAISGFTTCRALLNSGLELTAACTLVGGMLGLIGVGKETEDALKNVHKSIRFIETQVGSLHEKSEFDSEKSNFEEISKLIKRKVEQLNPEQRSRH